VAIITPGPYVTRKKENSLWEEKGKKGRGTRKRYRIQLAKGKSIEVTTAAGAETS